MTPDLQREVLAVLGEIATLSPDVRAGQLFAHLGFMAECHLGHGLGDVEDDELLAVMYRHRAELLARVQGDPYVAPQPTGSTTSVSGSPVSMESSPASAKV
jgi:hypothetical protein